MAPTLVAIPTTTYIQGISSAPGLVGVRQRIDSRALPNLLAFARGFHAAGNGRLEINEGARSRPRQDMLWDNWEAYLARGKRPPVAALAAFPYTSIHDEVEHGNAIDFGSGIGTSTTAASVWAHKHGPEYGVRGTGVTFSVKEWWHFDIDKSSTASSSSTPISADDPRPLTQEELDEMAATKGAALVRDMVRDGNPDIFRALVFPDGTAKKLNKTEGVDQATEAHVIVYGLPRTDTSNDATHSTVPTQYGAQLTTDQWKWFWYAYQGPMVGFGDSDFPAGRRPTILGQPKGI